MQEYPKILYSNGNESTLIVNDTAEEKKARKQGYGEYDHSPLAVTDDNNAQEAETDTQGDLINGDQQLQ